MGNDSLGTNTQMLIGNLGLETEALKYGQIDQLTNSKEEKIRQVEKIHQFLTQMKRCMDESNTAVNMDEEPYCQCVDEMRQEFGDEIFPDGIYTWRGKDQIDGLRESLNHSIQDLMAQVNINDMRISHILEETKQMLESLKKIGEMEQRMVEKALNKVSRGGG